MKEGQKIWSREELMLAINLYCKLPFGKINHRNEQVIELAGLIGRTPSSVALKLANIASLDSSLEAKGMINASKLDREVWQEFFQNLDSATFESEKILAEKKHQEVAPEISDIAEQEIIKIGKTREQLVKVRVNQAFFRRTVLAAYEFRCCITGINRLELLVASHIKPWAKDEVNRLNPRNGLALNALHDRAYDSGLLTVTPDYEILISSALRDQDMPRKEEYFLGFHGKKIDLPSKFLPDKAFLEYHYEHIFKK